MIQNFHLLINNFLEFSLLSFSGTKSIRQGKREQVEENLRTFQSSDQKNITSKESNSHLKKNENILNFSNDENLKSKENVKVEEVLPNRNLIAKFLSCRRNSTLLTNSNKGRFLSRNFFFFLFFDSLRF